MNSNTQHKTAKDILMYYFNDCDMQHHKGCLAPDCITCLDSRFQFMMMELFPDKYTKKATNENNASAESKETLGEFIKRGSESLCEEHPDIVQDIINS